MVDFSSVSFPPPKDWQAFERATRLLFQHVLADPNTQNNGRHGQRQHGVDVFGNRGGGGGRLVGIQCKGKDSDYGGVVTDDELKAEVKKTETFTPPLREFILVTTAPDDAVIQRAARLLEQKVRSEGRDLSIAVWGWSRVQQEIVRYPEVIKAFHSDATPFTDQIQNSLDEILGLLRRELPARTSASESRQAAIIPPGMTQIAVESHSPDDPLDRHLNQQIDTYRDFIRDNRPRTALELLQALKEEVWATASNPIRFRLIANIGSAYYCLGDHTTAAECFLEAALYNPEAVPAIANKIAALLIKNRAQEAHELAKHAIATHPANPDIALQRLQARAASETVEGLWACLSPELHNNDNLIAFRLLALREARDPSWRALALAAAEQHPGNQRLQIFKAETVLERVLAPDASMLGKQGADTPSQEELCAAADILEAAWEKSCAAETPPEISSAHNAALLCKILRQPERAAKLLDAAFARGLDADEALRLRLSFFRRAEQNESAIALADRLSDTPQARVLRADLRLASDPPGARAILAERAEFSERPNIIGAAQVVVDSFLKEEKFDEAFAEAERLAALLPDHPQGPLTRYRIKKARADQDADDELSAAIARTNDATDFPTRYLVCEALEKAGRHGEVVDLLNGRVATSFDSPALRSLIAAAANSDRRSVLKSLLEVLPPDVRKHSFFCGARIAFANRTGDIRAAEREIRAYLGDRPRSLEMHLQLLHILLRRSKLEALRGEARKPAADFDGTPLEFMRLAQFKDDFGDWREAHALAYTTLIRHPKDASAGMGYIGVFLRPGHSEDLEVAPGVIRENMAIEIRSQDGKISTFVIEPDDTLRPSAFYLQPSHPMAQVLFGQSPNSDIVLPDATRARIVSIKPKELHALHNLLENFGNLFSNAKGIERVIVDTSSTDGLQSIAQRLQERHDAITTIGNIYEAGGIPLALAARALGSQPIETMIGFSAAGRCIRVCQGTQLEREVAAAAIRSNMTRGCILDAITLHVVRRLEIDDVVTRICGPIGIVDRTLLGLQRRIYDLRERLDTPDMTLGWQDGQIYRTETTVAEKRAALELLERDEQWIRDHVTIVPAVGTREPGPGLRQIMVRFGSSFADELRAAQSSARLFVSEDHMLRAMGQVEFEVPSTWLQPVLMQARATGAITLSRYRKAVLALIDARFTFISIDANLLLDAIDPLTHVGVPDEYRRLAERLGGKDADLGSHAGVALDAIEQFWTNRAISFTVRQALVGTLIGSLMRERSRAEITAIYATFIDFGQHKLGDATLVASWRSGLAAISYL